MTSKLIKYCPDEVSALVTRLGERIRLARIRRKFRQSDLAKMAGISRSTMQAIERGEPTCSIGAVFHVLWVLGISNELNLIGDAGLDREGLALSLLDNGVRVYIPRKVDNDF